MREDEHETWGTAAVLYFGGLLKVQNGEHTIAPWDGTTVRLSNRHSLLNPAIKGIAAASTAAFGVFCGLQVTEFDRFLRFFL